jgi:hypothetical protein
VEAPLLLQFSIALFTGMVAATLVPLVRRAIPRALEVALWIGLFLVCTLGIVGVSNPSARELTSSALWGVDQIINTAVGLAMGGLMGWISENRFTIAWWLTVLAGVDLLGLALVRSRRLDQGWKPRVGLGEWMEMPPPAILAAQPALAADGLAELNRRLAASATVAGGQVLSLLFGFAIWMRDVVLPRGAQGLAHATEVRRVESRARLESFRDATLHLRFAVHSWYAAAGAPVVNDLGLRATEALRLAAPTLTPGEVIDIQALMSAQSIGWYGPLTAGTSIPAHGEEDGNEPERSDRLAS